MEEININQQETNPGVWVQPLLKGTHATLGCSGGLSSIWVERPQSKCLLNESLLSLALTQQTLLIIPSVNIVLSRREEACRISESPCKLNGNILVKSYMA